MRGARRVLMFCLLTAVLPTILLIIPLYLKHIVYADVTYAVAESDVIEISDGLSSLFCSEHSVKMNTTFHAFQVSNSPVLSEKKKHIQLLKDMNLPDDTFEYWGFFLPQGSNVILSVCSRFDGGRVLIVQGEKNLKTCALLDRTKTSLFAKLPEDQNHLKITYETNNNKNHNEKEKNRKLENRQTNDTLSEMEELEDNEEDIQDNKKTLIEALTSQRPSLQIRHKRTKKRRINDSQLEKGKIDKLKKLFEGKDAEEVETEEILRIRRELMKPIHVLDGGVGHGGTGNHTRDDESSASSFENDLIECYRKDTLAGKKVPTSEKCSKNHILEKNASMQITYNVPADGYYYYIFYSDNDVVTNHIYGIFDIHKPTYQYTNYSKGCINQTECTFTVSLWYDKTVVVEIPTRDGLKSDLDDHSYLISSCHPRMWVYAIFPIVVIFLILACAFI